MEITADNMNVIPLASKLAFCPIRNIVAPMLTEYGTRYELLEVPDITC